MYMGSYTCTSFLFSSVLNALSAHREGHNVVTLCSHEWRRLPRRYYHYIACGAPGCGMNGAMSQQEWRHVAASVSKRPVKQNRWRHIAAQGWLVAACAAECSTHVAPCCSTNKWHHVAVQVAPCTVQHKWHQVHQYM
jgi:hypothetical protein